MSVRPRLLPIVMVAAVGLLGVKASALWLDGTSLAAAWADTPGAPATPPAAAAPAAAPAPAKPPAAAAPAQAAAAKPDPAKPAAAKSGDATTADAKPAAAKPDAPAKATQDPMQMSAEEIGVLQQLADRRAELDKRAAQLREREVLMAAAEKRIDEKIEKLGSLQKSISQTVKTQDDKADAQVQSLAHMFEQMKPQDAARILDQLEVTVLLTVLERMREQKAAPILADMDPAKAKAITLALTARRDTPAAAPAPPQQTR